EPHLDSAAEYQRPPFRSPLERGGAAWDRCRIVDGFVGRKRRTVTVDAARTEQPDPADWDAALGGEHDKTAVHVAVEPESIAAPGGVNPRGAHIAGLSADVL